MRQQQRHHGHQRPQSQPPPRKQAASQPAASSASPAGTASASSTPPPSSQQQAQRPASPAVSAQKPTAWAFKAAPKTAAAKSDPIAAAITAAAANPHAAIGVWTRITTSIGSPLEGQIFVYDPQAGIVILQGFPEPESASSPTLDEQQSPSPSPSSPATPSALTRTPSTHSATAASPSEPTVSIHVVWLAHVTNVLVAQTPSLQAGSEPPSNSGTGSDSKSNSNSKNRSAAKSGSDSRKDTPPPSSLVPPDPIPQLIPIVPLDTEIIAAWAAHASRLEAERISKIGIGVTKEAQTIFDALSKTLPAIWRDRSILVMDEIMIDAPYKSSACRIASGKQGFDATLARVRKVLDGERKKLGLTE